MSVDSRLPDGWLTQTVGALIEDAKIGLIRSATQQATDKHYQYIKMQNFDINGDWVVDEVTRVDATDEEAATFSLSPGDLLFNTRNSSELVGKTAIWKGNAETVLYNNNLLRMRFYPAVTQEWVALQFKSPQFRKELAKIKSATTSVAAIYQKPLLLQRLKVPPLNEQRRIVAKFEDLSGRSRAAKEALDAIPPLLERFRQSVLAAAFRGDLTKQWREQNPNVEPASVLLDRIRQERRQRWEQDYLAQQKAKVKTPKDDKWKEKYVEPEPVDTTGLPELPGGWCWANCGDLAEIVTGSTPPTSNSDYYSGKVPFYKPTDLNAGYNLIAASQGLTELGAEEARIIPANSVLVTCIGATIGKTGFCRTAGATNQQINALIPAKTVVAVEWLYWWFVGPMGQDSILANASATTLPIINKGRFSLLPVPVPTLDEQREIVSVLEERISSANRTHAILGAFKSRFAQLDHSILAKAFRGELVPQDPDDEPASALLERIRADRANNESKGTGRKRSKS